MTFTGILFDVNSAMASMNSEPLELVNNAYTLATLNNNQKCILKINQCLLDRDPHAFEALLQPHQACHHGVVIDDVAKRHLSITGDSGKKCIKIDDTVLPLMFDGFKVFCVVQKLTPNNLDGHYPIYELTLSLSYKPQGRKYSQRLNVPPNTLSQWRANLGFRQRRELELH